LNDVPDHKFSLSAALKKRAPLLVLIAIAAVWLYRTPYSASNLEVPPDAVEYALAPLQFLETGHYDIVVEGRPLPPRYPPWFPTLVVLPAYLLFGHDPGNAILPVTLLAVAGIGFASAIGHRLGGVAGGILAGLGLLFLPSYAGWATQVMTDVPATALMLATCLLYLRMRSGQRSLAIYFAAGLLIAVATLFRPVFAAMLFPFLFEIWRTRQALIRNAVAVLWPMAGATIATLAYNAAAFGSPLRNGYKFWAAIPMDYPSLIFSAAYLKLNLWLIAQTVFPLYIVVCVAAWLVVRKREPAALVISRPAFRDALTFLVLTIGPILLFHLFYFFPSDRFHIPMFAGAAVIAGGMLGLLFQARTTAVLKFLLAAILVLVISAKIAVPEPVPYRRLAADRIRARTPDNAIVISGIEPVYLERLAGRGSSRRMVPISRNVEYASKLLVPKRVEISNAAALDWRNSRNPALLRGGAKEAIEFVASEQLDALVAQATAGTPVFLDTTFLGDEADVLNRMQQRFVFLQRAQFLYELRLR
jgi:4-amino-4-deoxy-L-arabinose transferase-like glycosyltransferase